MTALSDHLLAAFHRREALRAACELEQTNAYRLFHGTVEGVPGLTVDLYGDHILVQSFHDPLPAEDLEELSQVYRSVLDPLPLIHNERSGRGSRISNDVPDSQRDVADRVGECRELGVRHRVSARHGGADPLLFLDFRSARRHVLAHSRGRSVLNAFAYTCGIGVCAALGGATSVMNLDFAAAALEHGRQNALRNELESAGISFLQCDYFLAMRRFAGLSLPARRGERSHGPGERSEIKAQLFDLIILDPPRWAKSKHGTVDLVRDYQSVFRPCLRVLEKDGRILCTNNVAKVPLADWLDILQRCATKAGRPPRDVEVLKPEADFPSHDGNPPLKMALLSL